MAAGALGSVSNRLRHENGDTHVVDLRRRVLGRGFNSRRLHQKNARALRGLFFLVSAAKFCMQAAPSARLSSTNSRRRRPRSWPSANSPQILDIRQSTMASSSSIMHFVYMLRCADNSLYIGETDNI